MDENWQETLMELIVLCKCKNIAREFRRGIWGSAFKICLGIEVFPLGNRRIILLKWILSGGNNHLYTLNLIKKFYQSLGDFSQLPIDRSIATSWNECENTEKVLQRCSRAFFNMFGLISHQINSFNMFIWIFEWTGCEVGLRPIKKRRMRLKACHHYIWKSQR